MLIRKFVTALLMAWYIIPAISFANVLDGKWEYITENEYKVIYGNADSVIWDDDRKRLEFYTKEVYTEKGKRENVKASRDVGDYSSDSERLAMQISKVNFIWRNKRVYCLYSIFVNYDKELEPISVAAEEDDEILSGRAINKWDVVEDGYLEFDIAVWGIEQMRKKRA